MAEIHRRVFDAGGPALWFTQVKGSPFSAVSNLFGTAERTDFIFRHTLKHVQTLTRLKEDPSYALDWNNWPKLPGALKTALKGLPRKEKAHSFIETTLQDLPQIQSWPKDGGAFVTLPQVYSEHPDKPGWKDSNLGMYRVQLSGNEYVPGKQMGIHYQIHRGIGIHHTAAIQKGEKLKVSLFVGGPPSHTLAAIMPMPDRLSELLFAGMLGGTRFGYHYEDGHFLSTHADFCITGTIDLQKTLPEGPFGDHLGYYSLQHDFPYMDIEKVYAKPDAIWPFTVVGRPPQEDSSFGALIHQITGNLIQQELPGVKAVHAVDVAGVHPLMFAIAHERYVPYRERVPMGILTAANSILGYGQCSLAKYLLIAAFEDVPDLDIHNESTFLQHILERVDWKRDLHFQTSTTIDTLDYTGTSLNSGSKLVIAAAGKAKRTLPIEIPENVTLPTGYSNPKIALPGVLVVSAPSITSDNNSTASTREFCHFYENRLSRNEGDPREAEQLPIETFPLVLLVDDSAFAAETIANFLWVAFTRSDPASDIDGIEAFSHEKHWGCTHTLVLDARCKPHHAPKLEVDPMVAKRVEELAATGQPLHGLF
jgi:4-hydroxy-3-polyprenylbenzoate decarboxylase